MDSFQLYNTGQAGPVSNALASRADLVSFCTSATFSNPDLPSASFSSIVASPVYNYSTTVPDSGYPNNPTTILADTTFCNITVTYTHPGQNDLIHVTAFLPISSPTWNGRLQAVGGGGWVVGIPNDALFVEMLGAIGQGYATVTSDAGVTTTGGPEGAEPWAMVSPGNVNLYALQNYASVHLYDEKIIVDALMKDFFGTGAKYSYWSGCSTGGRQGLMLAQRYPDLYDGIAAAAPGVRWSETLMQFFWPVIFSNEFLGGVEPDRCHYTEIAARAVRACDGLDGVVDGVISDPDVCLKDFDPASVIGKQFNCSTTGQITTITREAVTFAKGMWADYKTTDGTLLWPGHHIGSDLAIEQSKITFASDWMKLFILRNSSFDTSNMTLATFQRLWHLGIQEYDSIIGTSDTDLSTFKGKGGKIITYHGLADSMITEKATQAYWEAVGKATPDIGSFYRYFAVPGLGHCANANGSPGNTFAALVNWVEKGVAPNTISFSFTDTNGTLNTRPLCSSPKKVVYNGKGNTTLESNFSCK